MHEHGSAPRLHPPTPTAATPPVDTSGHRHTVHHDTAAARARAERRRGGAAFDHRERFGVGAVRGGRLGLASGCWGWLGLASGCWGWLGLAFVRE
ncbi:hypothetical protein [Streptomyces capitiformicae]|uniref:Uncharacterized protein n=1 Tax=Streptomyces capitiformicae TaxID=2014920 RepID=A0A918ZAX3_9ACTN|nr:hypothetical protein [Streptomyces capitiformicae]GHE43757.1 hypothetical protein GCM10017771_63670 [Streptomyces capitiformicae]